MLLIPGYVLLSKYRIEKLLGSGGWGDVYLAEDLQLNRQVAIKHLKTDWTGDERILQRFLQEARVIASLKHPNVVTIHTLEQDNGEHYIVEEYAERGTLGDLLREQSKLSVEQALDITIAICRALEAAHVKGIIHRDIKPSNILLCETPEGNLIPKLCDFGIAHVPNAGDKSPLTADGDMLGTFQYMSPEQIQSREVDERSDLYSLGTVLYEMLTGRSVFVGSPWDVLQSHVNKTPRPPILNRPEMPEALNDLILQVLAKEPQARYQKAHDVQQILERIRRQEVERRERAEVFYAQGVAHLGTEEWQLAIDLFRRAAEALPGYRDVDELLAEAERQAGLARLYEQGLAHVRSGAWVEAAAVWEGIQQQAANYRDVAQQLAQARGQQNLATLYDEGVNAAQAQDWPAAGERFAQILQIDGHYRDADSRLQEARKQQRLAEWYTQGISHLEKKEWLEAIRCFKAITAEDVTYREAAAQLELARRQDELESLYAQGMGYVQKNDWQQAIARFEAVLELDRSYKDTPARLEAARQQAALQAQYSQAIAHFERGEWSPAIERLQSVLQVAPEYQDAAARLNEAQQQQELARRYRQGMAHLKKREWQPAVAALEPLVGVEGYGGVEAQLAQARQWLALDTAYAAALQHEQAQDWALAAELYLQILEQERDYRDAAERLGRAQKWAEWSQLRSQAQTHLAAGRWQEAIECLDAALEIELPVKRLNRQAKKELASMLKAAHKGLERQKPGLALEETESRNKRVLIFVMLLFIVGLALVIAILLQSDWFRSPTVSSLTITEPRQLDVWAEHVPVSGRLECSGKTPLSDLQIIVYVSGIKSGPEERWWRSNVPCVTQVKRQWSLAADCTTFPQAYSAFSLVAVLVEDDRAPYLPSELSARDEDELMDKLAGYAYLCDEATPCSCISPVVQINRLPDVAVVPTDTPTPRPTLTFTATASPRVQPEPSATPTPGATHAPSPTATTAPTSTPSATPTATLTITRPPTHTPTPSPTPAPTLLPAPRLLSPPNGERYCPGWGFKLEWAWDGRPFQANEYYAVRIWRDEPEHTERSKHWEPDYNRKSFDVLLEERSDLPPDDRYYEGVGTYNWNIIVLFDTGEVDEQGFKKWQPVSEESEWRQFIVLPRDDAYCLPP